MPDEIQAHCLSDLCPNISLFTTNKSTPSSSASRRERTHQIGGALPQEVRQRKVRTGNHRDGHSPAKPNGTGLPGAHRGRPARRKRLAVKGKGLPIWRKRPDLEPADRGYRPPPSFPAPKPAAQPAQRGVASARAELGGRNAQETHLRPPTRQSDSTLTSPLQGSGATPVRRNPTAPTSASGELRAGAPVKSRDRWGAACGGLHS